MAEDDPPKTNRHMVGYARVSMDDQTNRRQIAALVEYGVPEIDIFTDTASGKDMNRPGWEALWKDMQRGDLLVVHAIDRLGRNLGQLVATLDALEKRGIDLKVLTMPIDTRDPIGKLIFHIMAAFAQFERTLINERTADGLRRAREAGRTGGAKAKHTHEAVLAAHAQHGVKPAAWKALGLTKSGYIKARDRALAWLRKQQEQSNVEV